MRLSLSSAPFYASALVITVLGLFIGTFWAINEYQAYQESVENIINNYHKQYQQRVKEELEKVVDFIEYKRLQMDMQVEQDLRTNVQSAYTIASHMFSSSCDHFSDAEIRDQVIEILRPIRWNNGKGFYFVGKVNEARIELFSDEPYYEGKTADSFFDASGKPVIKDLIQLVKNEGAGLYHFDMLKPAFPDKTYEMLAFVKYFAPFDWFIGAGIYIEDIEKDVQNDVISRIRLMRFGNDGDVLGFRKNGTIIVAQDETLLGRNVNTLIDDHQFNYGKTMLDVGLGRIDDHYVRYGVMESHATDRQKMNYVQLYPDWGWVLTTGMFMDEMESAIQAETDTYEWISFRNVLLFCVMFGTAVILLLLAAYIYSRKIKKGINHFTDFFRKAAEGKMKIQRSELAFSEFEVIGALANQMVDDRIQKELILQRNELRQDTLLRLGEMEDVSLQEKYDFVLQRVIEITRSKGGYLALVNSQQTFLTLCSLVVEVGVNSNVGFENGQMTSSVERSGLAGLAVSHRKPVMANTIFSLGNLEPYQFNVFNHLDVPVIDGDKIVLVCGVCNRNTVYNKSDIRQISMLLEGLWLHVLKTCSEKELANLERQVIAASQEERARIGQDLHDGLCSHLSGVELLSMALQKRLEQKTPEEAKQLGMIRGLIKEAIGKTGQLARGLYPVHLNDQGLQAALEELMAEVEGAFPAVKCSMSYNFNEQQIDISVATHIYYIVREAVFNGVRHGDADRIDIAFEQQDTRYTITVADNGSGFEQNTTRKGLGLHTMKYRAKGIGVEMLIDSEVGHGTRIIIEGEVE